MHIAKANVFGWGIDLQRDRLLLWRADHDGVANGDHCLLLGVAAIGAFNIGRTRRGTDVLALMTKTARALSDIKTARFAESIPPGIAGISPCQFVRRLFGRSATPEFLRMDECHRFLQWKSNLGIGGKVGAAALLAQT